MAATLTQDDNVIRASFPIMKWEEDPNDPSTVYVYGKATTPEVDTDEQVVASDFSGKALQEWLETAPALRVQHNSQRDPAGSGVKVEINRDGDGAHWVKAAVDEPTAVRLVKKGHLRAYSVGIAAPVIERDVTGKARNGIIKGGKIVEVSLVDSPANRSCFLELVKSSADGSPEFTGKMFGADLLTKSATGGGTVSLDLPSDVSVSFTPGDLAKLIAHRRVAEEREALKAAEPQVEKKDVRPEVGGGVDVDKLPDSDFAGRGRSFPIVTPGDVSDAASSIGRAGPDNYSSDKLKANIIAIARRKGDAFVKELPESWKKELGGKKDKAADAGKGKKPFPGAHPAFGPGHQPPHTDEDDAAIARRKKKGKAKKAGGAPQVAKGAKSCTKCGKAYDADSKVRKCEGCGTRLPKADKNAAPAAVKKDKVLCPGCGANVHDKHKFCPECGKSLAGAEPIDKNHKFTCLGCGHDLDKGEKFCGHCGKSNPGYLPAADAQIGANKNADAKGDASMAEKAKKPTPGDSVVGQNTDPVPEHREPDGAAFEAFEHDAGLPTVPDDQAMKAAMRLSNLGVPADQGALHDLLCPAYHPADAVKAHPYTSLDRIDTADWQAKALDLAVAAPIDQAQRYADLGRHAAVLKAADLAVIDELRLEAHKNFRDANPGPATFPTPAMLTPQRFNRPYLSAGHAAPSPGQDAPHHVAEPPHEIAASQFHRDYLTAGHAADSPANTSHADPVPAPAVPGVPSRVYYSNAMKDNARQAMAAMHDHIAATFPDLCPMHGPGHAGEPAAGARPVPAGIGGPKPHGASKGAKAERRAAKAAEKAARAKAAEKRRKLERAVFKGKLTVDEARAKLGLDPFGLPETAAPLAPEVVKAAAPAPAPVLDPEVIKAAVAEATQPLAKALKAEQKRSRQLAKAVDALGAQPDPGVTAWRGANLGQPPLTKSSEPPAGTPLSGRAERALDNMVTAMFDTWRNDPDPGRREDAWAYLKKVHGI